MPKSQIKPNILLVILDTLRRDRLSIYGNKRETSPQFDAFADDHILFERAVAPAQWTIPAHSSMFTGLYPSNHGVTQANGALSGMNPTVAEILQASGYHTVAFCNNPLVGVLDNGLQRGFSEFYNYASAIPNRPQDAHQNNLYNNFKRWFRPYARQIGNQFAHNDTAFRLALHPLFVPFWSKSINFKGNTANSIDDFIHYWKHHHAGGAERPVFGFLNLMGAHLPYHPPQNYLDKVAPELKREKRAFSFMRHMNADAGAWSSPLETPMDEWQSHTIEAFYDAEIAHQDYHLGRLLNYLKTSGTLDNTAVFVLADHGEMHGEHDYFGHGFSVHQELIHVPMAVHLPEAKADRISANISTRRLFHTLIDLAGAHQAVPLEADDPNADVRGLSLSNVIHESQDAEAGLAISEAFPPMTFINVIAHREPVTIDRLKLREIRRTLYDGDHKLTIVGDKVEALYQVDADPTEANNIAQAEAPRTEAMRRKLLSMAGDTKQLEGDGAQIATTDEAVMEQLRALGYIE